MKEDIKDICDTIKTDIINGKCVLILGPDLYIKEIDGTIWERKQYFKKLAQDNPGISYFDNDGVFVLKENELRLEKEIKKFYTGDGDVSLLELISKIKFPLIINASPDRSLYNFLHNIDQGARDDYFKEVDKKDTQNESLTDNDELKFSFSNPLIYNVFGSVKEPQSLIITHASLYKAMQILLPEDSLPKPIKKHIHNARSFLFLGFKFDSWSYQLLSYKILSENSAVNRRIRLSSSTTKEDDPINIIMTTAVAMDFTDLSPSQIIQNVISLLNTENPGLLRTPAKQEKYTSFLSYAHQNTEYPNLDRIVKAIQLRLKTKGDAENVIYKTVFDKHDLPYGQSIDSFMTRIGMGKVVILVISDRYLRSEYCMMEALRVYKHNNEDKRVFLVLIKDNIKIKNGEIDIEEYKGFWIDKIKSLIDDKVNFNKDRIWDCSNIHDFFPDFVNNIHGYKHFKMTQDDIDENLLFYQQEKEDEFEKYINDVINKMKED